MIDPLSVSALFPSLAFLIWVAVPAYAFFVRGRLYAAFALVILSLSIPGALILHQRLTALTGPSIEPLLHLLFAFSMGAAGIQLAHLVRAKLRSTLFRVFISIPGQTFVAVGLLAAPWLLALLPIRLFLEIFAERSALSALTIAEALPLPVAILSVATSVATRSETVRFALSKSGPAEFERLPVERFPERSAPAAPQGRPLRLVQITDTHLGPWQSIERLRGAVADLVARDPDIIALTGDFLTMESMGSPGCLEEALAPLGPIADRCVAIFGNHDHEAPDQVNTAMQKLGIPILMNEELCLQTEAGPVQIVGSDFVNRDHQSHLSALLSQFPRRDGHVRLLLLHDPVGFHALPDNDVDLVLSGHTHGGQVGLVSLGIDWTALTPTRWPDQGLFAKGRSRLYVHRGTGFYGFPLRVGVPAEFSLLEISGLPGAPA